MMDLSDGLGADLPRLAAASSVGFAIEEKAPRTRGCSVDAAINDGEDYELLFAIAPNDASSLQRNGAGSFRVCTHSYRRLASGRRLRASAFLPWLRSFQ
jgi:thiamine-monophosphate kinase